MSRFILVKNGKILVSEFGELPEDGSMEMLVLKSYKFKDFQVVTEFTAETPMRHEWVSMSQMDPELAEQVGEALLCGA